MNNFSSEQFFTFGTKIKEEGMIWLIEIYFLKGQVYIM